MNRRLSSSNALIRTALLAITLFAGALGEEALAQTNRATAANSGHRFLFIFDTSRPMERRVDGALQTVQSVLSSSLKNQLRSGDTLGVWTYNEDLYTGRLPLQEWAPATANKITSTVSAFLIGQKFEKQPHFYQVLPTLQRLVTNSMLLTIVLVSSGEDEVHGTPFDDQINTTYTQWRAQQEKNRMPFVTLLRVVQGKMTACAVTAAPWPLDVPPLPPEANVAQTKSAAPVQKPGASTPRALVFSGRKNGRVATNQPPEISAANPDLAASNTQTIVVTAAPGPDAAVRPATSATSEPPKPASTGTPAATVAGNEPQPASGTTPQQNPTSAQLSESAKPAQAVAHTEDTPKSPVSTEASPLQVPEAERRASQPARSSNALAGEALARTIPPAQIPADAPWDWLFSTKGFLLLPAVLLGFVLWVRWIRKRRAEARRPISLITRSLDTQHR